MHTKRNRVYLKYFVKTPNDTKIPENYKNYDSDSRHRFTPENRN